MLIIGDGIKDDDEEANLYFKMATEKLIIQSDAIENQNNPCFYKKINI